VEPLESGSKEHVLALFKELTESKKDELLWWGKLFKSFPSFKKALTEETKKEISDWYLGMLQVADDDSAVASAAGNFVVQHLQAHFISLPMWWRMSEALGDALQECAEKKDRYSQQRGRAAVERITKIALNQVNDEVWAHFSLVDPTVNDVGSFRPWHEAGYY
jgi:hypothetical protein